MSQRELGLVTSKDIAKLAGVSQSTVSRVLNGSTLVTPETRERVLSFMGSYSPNANARAMRTNRTQTIGVVVSEITNPFYPELLEAIYRACDARGLTVTLWNEHDPAAPAAVSGVRRGLVDGICFVSATSDASAVHQLAEQGFPTVLINRGMAEVACDQVTSDNYGAGRLAAEYLVNNGVTRIGMVSGLDTALAVVERRHGFLDVLHEHGINVRADWTVSGPLSFETGYSAANIIASGHERPEAIFCGNDLLGFGVASSLQHMRVGIPSDMWVMGVDDLPMASWEAFNLTSIRQSVNDMATIGLEMLTERIDGLETEPRKIHLPTHLVIRNSTAHRPLQP
ncbi:LacI family DNA-binding transcriptional regulator [Arthrobacter sp. ISL-69]|uniref:LacI family DNA-binding transcriptional regulator n=1 Tax=Arthrobacter sp. ISL-69 TaxID=2819113 RepID=UPI001BED06AC|nr:LacI family DNA-binding transcriptional regulator [Arthrobacter sp. ISL-69]MBT2539056.1 LacI family DNA-binding transcriptional regulator [Arthrobacter sp. ISL-69]